MTTAGQGSINRKTFMEGLSGLMGQIGQLMGMPDSDPGFCQALLQACRQRIAQAAPSAVPMGYGEAGPRTPEGAPGPALGGPTPNGVSRGYTVPPEAMGPAASMPNPDEMRRVIGAAQGL